MRLIGLSPEKKIKPELDEFHSAISVNSTGIWSSYLGLNYLHHLSELRLKKESHHYYIDFGSGLYNRSQNQPFTTSNEINKSRGYYLEFGFRVEMRSKRKPKNRLHFGINLNHRFDKEIAVGVFEEPMEFFQEEEFSLQFPVGYTYRASNGFFFSTGLKITTAKVLSLLHLGCGMTLF